MTTAIPEDEDPALAAARARRRDLARAVMDAPDADALPPLPGAGRALRYRVSDWLLARRNEEGRDER